MLVRRLTWAGVEITTESGVLLIDPLLGRPALSQYAGDPREELIAPSAPAGTVSAVAVTHLHTDHFDAERLRELLASDSPVLCPADAADGVSEAGHTPLGLQAWETAAVAGLNVTAVPAVDGFGSAQVSWVVSAGDARLIHCGDTLWHGYWWQIAERLGPFDLAFLPINAAVAEFDYLQPPTGIPAVLTPEQAAAAAEVLRTLEAAPIHYGTFNKPPTYIAMPDAEAAFVAAAERRQVAVRLLQGGDQLELSHAPQRF